MEEEACGGGGEGERRVKNGRKEGTRSEGKRWLWERRGMVEEEKGGRGDGQ